MDVVFLASARMEFDEAAEYYGNQRERLGDEFVEEVFRTINRVIQHPHAWTSLSRRTRRCLANRFPYGILYQVRGRALLIVAVMHLHRQPQAWKFRLPRSEA